MQQTAIPEDDLYYTEASAGEILRHTREYYNQSLFDIEKALRIRASQIEALEQNNYQNLPGRVYVIGFVRSYAEYLGLDPERMVNLYKSQMTGHVSDPQLHFPAAASESRLPSRWTFAACGALLLALISFWSYSLTASNKTDIQAIPQVASNVAPSTQVAAQLQNIAPASGQEIYTDGTDAEAIPSVQDPAAASSDAAATVSPTATEGAGAPTDATPTAEQGAPATAAPTTPATEAATVTTTDPAAATAPTAAEATPATAPTEPAPAVVDRSIKLNLLQNSWVEIRDGTGQVLVSRVLKAGEVYELKNRSDLVMSIGNAGGVEFTLGGNKLGPLGKAGEVVRNFPINYTSLQEKYGLSAENAVNQAPEQ